MLLNFDTDELVNAITWSDIEVNVAVLCANLPTLRPVLQKLWPFYSKSTHQLSQGAKISSETAAAFLVGDPGHRARKDLQSLHDGVDHSVTTYIAEGDPEQGHERSGGIHITREIRNDVRMA